MILYAKLTFSLIAISALLISGSGFILQDTYAAIDAPEFSCNHINTTATHCTFTQSVNGTLAILDWTLKTSSTAVAGSSLTDIEITNVTGLPPHFDFSCDPVSCIFPGEEINCAQLYSTSNPTASDIGVYNVIIATEIHTSDIPFLQNFTINDTIDYYTITISGLSSVFDKLYKNSFELKDIYPNPVNEESKIQVITGESTDVIFSVFNYLGETIEERSIALNRGVNDIEIFANDYANGMYLYSINNGVQILSKRMIVAN